MIRATPRPSIMTLAGFKIPMQHAAVVGRRQARAELARELQHLGPGQMIDALQQRREILAVDEFHREEMVAVDLVDVVDAADVRVRDLPGDADLGMEAFAPDGIIGQRLGQKLQRDRLAELQIVGPVDLAHAAATEQTDDAEAPSQHGPRRVAAHGDAVRGQETRDAVGDAKDWHRRLGGRVGPCPQRRAALQTVPRRIGHIGRRTRRTANRHGRRVSGICGSGDLEILRF